MTSSGRGLFFIPERLKQVFSGWIALVLRRWSVPSRIASDIGEIASFHLFVKERFGKTSYFLTREALALHCLRVFSPAKVFEFGVSKGEFCRYLIRKGPKVFTYFGFDTFSGLPNDWIRGGIKYLPKGAFNQNGESPNIDSPRVHFIKGLVEENLSQVDLLMSGEKSRMFILDMDLFEPTKILFDFISPKLKKGDVIIFDQAFDSHNERKIIIDSIISDARFSLIGASGIAAAFLVK